MRKEGRPVRIIPNGLEVIAILQGHVVGKSVAVKKG
jgi:hypothetical protein